MTDYVHVIGSKVEKVPFHEAATVPAQGKRFDVKGNKTLTVEIFGTATSASVSFKAVGMSGALRDLMGVKVSDLSSGTSGGMNEIWQFDITGLETVVMDLTAVSGGDVSVIGRAVA